MIGVRDLKKTYSPGTRSAEEVLHGVSFDLPETGFVCILGRSGSGKTSLLNAIGGLDVFDSGTVGICGETVSHSDRRAMEKLRNANFGYVFQNYYLLSEHSCAYNVYLGLNSLDLDEKEKLKRVEDALKKVDMLRFRKRLVGELSGGQQQRIAIARAVAKSPKVIFADEPTGNLDEESTLNICALLKKLSKTSLVVMVTHEERLADFFADRIITIDGGNIVSDITEWERGAIVSADRNIVYSGDYKESVSATDAISLRILAAGDAAPAEITLVIEDGRIIIKTDDKRLVMHSKPADPPVIKEGSRPKLDLRQFETDVPDGVLSERPPVRKGTSHGLGLKMLSAEMRTAASKKKLRSAATGLFLVLLSIMLLLSISDVTAAARVRKEEFITADSHVLVLKFSKGKEWNDRNVWSIADRVPDFLDLLDKKGLDYDLFPGTNRPFEFASDILPQYGVLSMYLRNYNLVDIKRLDPSTIVYGRMPERFDEIVVDKWVLRNCTERQGIVQNLIPDNEYMLGKRLYMDRKQYYPRIVGICDSGEPSVYLSRTGLLSVGIHGVSAISYSDFVSITGYTDLAPLERGECALIEELAPSRYLSKIGGEIKLSNGVTVRVREAVEGSFYNDFDLVNPIIFSDEYMDELLRTASATLTQFEMWCADKEAVKKAIPETLPEELRDVISIEVDDTYGREYSEFMTERTKRLQTRFIITASVGLLCLVMLYVLQRFRVRDRMGMIAVYRMLGIPGRDSVGVFILENLLLTARFAVPAVFLTWAVVTVLPLLGVSALSIEIPLWVTFATLGAIVLAEIAVAVLAVGRLLRMPPAKLASKYDF